MTAGAKAARLGTMRIELLGEDPDAVAWFASLPEPDRYDVLSWMSRTPPPDTWKGTDLSWALTECPVGIFSRRYGRLL